MKRFLQKTVLSDRKHFKILRIVAGMAAAALPFVVIFSRIEPGSLQNALHEVRWWTIPVLLLLSFMAMVLQGTRWWILIRAFTAELSFGQSLALHFKSAFYSLFLPNSTMQDVVRSVLATKHIGAVISWSSAWINKIMGILVSFSFSVLGIALLPRDTIPKSVLLIVAALFLVIVLLFFGSFTKKFMLPFKGIARKIIPRKIFAFMAGLHDGIWQFRNKKRHLVLTFLAAVFGQLIIVSAILFMIRGITGSFFVLECMAFVPLIEIISITQPFTPNGVGVREALVALMFGHLGLSPEQLGVYIVISNLSMFLRLVGAIPVLADTLRKRKLK